MSVDVTRLSANGQVVIPKGIRDKLGLRPGEELIAMEVDGAIVLISASSEAIRSEFEAIMEAFDRRLGEEVEDLDAVELVRRLRAGA